MGAIFLSHASADSPAAADLAAHLERWGHRSLFLDFHPEQGIPAGADWEAELYRQLKMCRAVVALVSDAWLASRWCFAEATQARALGKVVVPVLIAPCSPGDSLLADRQVVDLTGDREQGLARLRRGLDVLGLGDDLPFDPERPYPGLASFGAADAGVYFGRERERDRLLDLLERMRRRGEPRLAVVLGASGCGKSSLVRAGVLPRLRRDAESWLVVPPLRPGGDPRRALASVLAAAFAAAGAPRGWRALHEELGTGDRPWSALAEDLRRAAGAGDAGVLLVVDQAEELLTAPAADDRRAAFLSALARELSRPGGPLLVLATLRSDFLGAFQERPELHGLPFADLPLGPLPLERLPRVIEGPAGRVGLEIEDGLTARLVRDTARDDALPLLAFSLRELWERRRGDGWTFDLYESELGTIEGAVGRIADDIAGRLAEDEETALRAAFLRLVRLDDEGRLVRRPARWSDLPPAAHPLLERFVADRLLVSRGGEEGGEGDGDERWVEVAHEAIFRTWERLARWLDEARELLLFRRRLGRARREWRRTGDDPGALLRGAALAEAERWLEERRDELDDDERRYVAASVAAERRRRFRLVAGLAAGLLVALALTAVATFQWWRAEGETRRAEEETRRTQAALRLSLARQLAIQADAELDDSAAGLVHGLLLATESLRSAWTHDGYGVWARAVALLPPRAWKSFPAPGAVTALAAHPERPWLALAADGEEEVRVLDVLTGSEVVRLDHPSPTYLLGFSPDGRWLAAVVGDRITVWRVDTWRLTRRLQAYGHVDGLVFTGDESGHGPGMVAGQREVLADLPPVPDDELPPPLGMDRYALSVAYHPRVPMADGAAGLLAVGSAGEVALWRRPWQLRDDGERWPVRGSGVGFLDFWALTFTEDGSELLLAVNDQLCTLDLRSLPAEPPPREEALEPTACVPATSDGSDPVALSVVDAGHVLVQADRSAPTVRLFATGDTAAELARLPLASPALFTLARRGGWLAAPSADGVALHRVDRLAAGAAVRLPPAAAVAFSPDGRWLASAGREAVRVHRVGSWSEVLAAPRTTPERAVLAFTGGGGRLLAYDGTVVRLFEPDGGGWSAVASVDTGDRRLDRLAPSPDGRLLRTESTAFVSPRGKILHAPGRTRIWDLETGEEVAWRSNEERDVEDFLDHWGERFGTLTREDLEIEWEAEGWAAGPDGHPLGAGGRVDLLAAAAEWPEIPLAEPPWWSDSPDGRWNCGARGLLREPGTEREVVVLGERQTYARYHAFSPDLGAGSEWLALAGDDALDVHRLGPVDALVAETCRRLPRNLRPEEWPLDGAPPVTCPDL